MQTFKEFWIQAFKVAGKKDLFFSASAITFNLFICSIPFTLILVAIIGYVLSYDQAFNYIVQLGSDYLPAFAFQPESSDVISGSGTVEELIRPLVGARQVFGIIGFIILVFFTQGLLHSLKHVLFDVFDIVERKHPIIDIIYNFFGFGLIGTVFLFFSLAISMFSFVNFSQIYVPFTDIVIQLPWIYDFLNLLIPVLFIFMLLYIVFRFLSERKIAPKVALVGALSYTVLFEVARFIISNYLEYAFSTYRYFYQGYAIAFLIVIWTFYTSLLFVISVVLARAYRDVYSSHRPTLEDNPYSVLD
ncbi:MAG: YihY/virulence factor BrkB family protein [Balneolaceae bacterium]